MDAEKIRDSYKERLDTWIVNTKQSQKELASITRYFPPNLKRITESTITNVKKSPPTRVDSRQSLYSLLGSLLIFQVIDEANCKEFLECFDIAYTEDGKWNDIWELISAAAHKADRLLPIRNSPDDNIVLKTPGIITEGDRLNDLKNDLSTPLSLGKDDVGSIIRKTTERTDKTSSVQCFVGKRLLNAIVVIILLLILGILFVYVAFGLRHTDRWCVASPSAARRSGDVSRLYFEDGVHIDNFAKYPFYIYFKQDYISYEILKLEGFEQSRNQWVVVISSAWVAMHPDWSNSELWKVQYTC